jgi:hypothetical protein
MTHHPEERLPAMGLFEWNAACCSPFYRLKSGDCEAWPVADVMERVDSLDYQVERRGGNEFCWQLQVARIQHTAHGHVAEMYSKYPEALTQQKSSTTLVAREPFVIHVHLASSLDYQLSVHRAEVDR